MNKFEDNQRTLKPRKCKFCNRDLRPLVTDNYYVSHLINHFLDIRKELSEHFQFTCKICQPTTEHARFTGMRKHLQQDHRIDEMVMYYYRNFDPFYSD